MKKAGVKIRILLWDYPLSLRTSFADSLVRLSGKIGIFEVIYQPHPTETIGSWHQKTIVIDDTYAFVSGMNAKKNDWDTSEHLVFDGRRADFRLTAEERKKINVHKDYDEINPPRRDYMTFVMGSAVTFIQSNFVERWNYCIDQKIDYYKKATKLQPPTLNSPRSSVQAQITRTIPKYSALPKGENSILESYKKAISLAEKYIYIENQYFRSQTIAKEIAKAIKKNKKLIVIVVTQPDYLTEIEPGESWKIGTLSTYWTAKAYNIIKSALPQFVLFYLQSTAVIKNKRVFKTIDVHSKIMIVDDDWYTIGSANVNERGFDYEGELNIAVQHSSALDLRKKIFANLLNEPCPDSIKDAVKLWYKHAAINHKAFNAKSKPKSFIYPFGQGGPSKNILPNDWV